MTDPIRWRTPADDEYLLLVGRVTYTFAYLEWVIIWLWRKKLDPDASVERLAGYTAGKLGREFYVAVGAHPEHAELLPIAVAFRRLATTRDDVVHAHPATTDDGLQQRLYRWSPTRGATPRWLDEETLTEFVRDMEALASAVSALMYPPGPT